MAATPEARELVEALLTKGVSVVLTAAQRRLESARTGARPMNVQSWRAFADALESQARSIREWCAAVEGEG